MRTKEELATIIARQTPENNPAEIVIKSYLTSETDEKATEVIFDCGDRITGTPAVIWDDDTCFTPSDWTQGWENYDDVDWYDHEHGKFGFMFNGLPRLFA